MYVTFHELRFGFLTTERFQIILFCEVTPFSLVGDYKLFIRTSSYNQLGSTDLFLNSVNKFSVCKKFVSDQKYKLAMVIKVLICINKHLYGLNNKTHKITT